MVQEMIDVAINFLFPRLSIHSDDYLEIANFIHYEYQRLGTAVLYCRNAEFMKLLQSSSLSIGNKEVILVGKAVCATQHYHSKPHIIFEAQ